MKACDTLQDPAPPYRTESREESLPNVVPIRPLRDEPPAPPTTEPDVDRSWDEMMRRVRKYDEDLCKGWKEDIDTLLVFAGLFSATVTAFTIESYQWLSEDAADTTVTLLSQISQQLSQPGIPLPTNTPFEASASSIRINCLWFLSLVMGLTCSLFALLCKQWLREHQRDTHTRTPEEALGLRQLRHDSLQYWGLPRLIATLPVLLELALLLFFAGLLELLWNLEAIPLFVVGCVAIGMSVAMYIATTIIPGVSIIWPILRSKLFPDDFAPGVYRLVCPYKSPQAWAFFRLLVSLLSLPRILDPIPLFSRAFLKSKPRGDRRDFSFAVASQLRGLTEWSVVDLRCIIRGGQTYQFEGFRWLISLYRDTPSIKPYLHSLLRSYSSHNLFPTTFPQYRRIYTWTDPMDVDLAGLSLGLPISYNTRNIMEDPICPLVPLPVTPSGVDLIRRICLNSALLLHYPSSGGVVKARRISKENVSEQTGIRFTLPFHAVESLWKRYPDDDSRVENMGLELLDVYREEWEKFSRDVGEPTDVWDERYQVLASFARHLHSQLPEHQTALLTDRGVRFLRFINEQAITFKLSAHHPGLMETWNRAMRLVQQAKELPGDFFGEITPRKSCLGFAEEKLPILDSPDTEPGDCRGSDSSNGIAGRIREIFTHGWRRTCSKTEPVDSPA
ncbi:hypothetical protein V5O48_002272 [Marasmius crinis-equi]|uniref:DUF6535 domain-containing protein n=1 Tax=Marasmius crinis-equi TaxID=585013 RepID=A0ABR3FWT4_9AGAR